ncbi:MAG: hypothetical protein U5K55_00545 [Aliarcobacter sp.]|nr:hypothetical protein [Aliarcobacter sp.]
MVQILYGTYIERTNVPKIPVNAIAKATLAFLTLKRKKKENKSR